MKRLLQEPLLHFILLGALLFGLNAFVGERSVEAGGGDIVVSAGRVENLAALFAKTWQRPPTVSELQGLVDDYVLEEALYREGLALGIDRDDTIIRRRVRQKMEFFASDLVEQAAPTDAELADWLGEHAETYAIPARFTFRQIYLDRERRGTALEADAQRVLADLRAAPATADPRPLGDTSLLAHGHRDVSADLIARDFGQEFADGLGALPRGEWTGPLASAFGLHFVFIDAHAPAQPAALSDVRDDVVRDWSYAQREQATQRFHGEVLARYRVSVEWPIEAAPAGE